MSLSFTDRMLATLPAKLDRNDPVLLSLLSNPALEPSDIIIASIDFNSGAAANELAWANKQVQTLISYLGIVGAEGIYLRAVVHALVDLLPYDSFETDEAFLNRFLALITQKGNSRRTTRWSIKTAVAVLIEDDDESLVRIVEWFHVKTQYFQVRVSSGLFLEAAHVAFVNQEYVNQSYVAGISLPAKTISEIEATVRRVKAAGVDFDVFSVLRISAELAITAKVV